MCEGDSTVCSAPPVAPQHAPWRIVLIGGSSGVGKTVVSDMITRHFGVSRLLVDDLRLALQQMTTPAQHPALHHFEADPTVWQREPEVLRDRLIATSEALRPALAMVIAHHLFVAGVGPLIIEGDNILPGLARQRRFPDVKIFGGLEFPNVVRALFLVEPDEGALLANMRARGRGFQGLTPIEQRTQARASWLYGQWLQREAQALDLPVVPPRPWDTLTARTLAVLG